jgi:hypothetical protein
MDEAPTVVELLVGAVMAKSVALNLATLYEITGRTNEARSIREAIDGARPVPLPGNLGKKGLDGWDVLDALPSVAGLGDIPQALKWEWVQTAQAVKLQQYRVGDDELGADYAAWRHGVRNALVRRRSDGLFFDWISQKPARRGAECYGPSIAAKAH